MNSRRSYYVKGLAHGQPIPTVTMKGPILATGGVTGVNPDTGELAAEIGAQCAQMFANVRLILAAAGSSTEDVLKMTVWVKDKTSRSHINQEWLAMFPDEHSRPVRHTMINHDLPGTVLVQCDVLAVKDGKALGSVAEMQ